VGYAFSKSESELVGLVDGVEVSPLAIEELKQ